VAVLNARAMSIDRWAIREMSMPTDTTSVREIALSLALGLVGAGVAAVVAYVVTTPLDSLPGHFLWLLQLVSLACLGIAGYIAGRMLARLMTLKRKWLSLFLASPGVYWVVIEVVIGGWQRFLDEALFLSPFVVVSFICAVLGFHAAARTQPKPVPQYCLKCGYNLRGNVSGRCPECGSALPDEQRRALSELPCDEDQPKVSG